MEDSNGYYRYPTVFDNRVVFVSEDDLWMVPLGGGTAIRMTSGVGRCANPFFSPDGQWIAFDSSEEGHREIFIIPSGGGPSKRLTYLGGLTSVSGWQSATEILFRTEAFEPNRMGTLATVSIEGGEPKSLNLGPAHSMTIHPSTGAVVLERNSFRAEPAYWKRYRGGTAGKFFSSAQFDGEFKLFLSELNGNLTRPMWIGDRLFFLSDHEGIANIYSCEAGGTGLKRETNLKSFYVRNPSTDGRTIVFHAGAELYQLDAKGGESVKIKVQFPSQRTQRQRKFVPVKDFLESWNLSADGSQICLTTRGQIAAMENWAGPVGFIGRDPGVRYRLGAWFDEDSKVIFVSDEGGEEHLGVFDVKTRDRRLVSNVGFGRVTALKPSPVGSQFVAVTTHNNELHLVDVEKGSNRLIARSEVQVISSLDWSPDGRFIAYVTGAKKSSSRIEVYDLQTEKSHIVTREILADSDPSFDPTGKYLYYVTTRELNPTYDELQHELGFNKTTIVCMITLQKDQPSPLIVPPKKSETEDAVKKEQSGAPGEVKNKKKIEPVQIDFDGIQDRVVRLPLPAMRIRTIQASKDKVFFMTLPVEGAIGGAWLSKDVEAKGEVQVFDLQTGKAEPFTTGVTSFSLSKDQTYIALQCGTAIRVLKTEGKPEESRENEEYSAKKGWVDLERMKILVEPAAEWKQMLHEVWRLQRDHFWREDMSKIQWQKVFELYRPLLDRVSCRSEFGDLVWELQGELGTSHAYDFGGDYREAPQYSVGSLGATFAWDASANGYVIEKIWRGDMWAADGGSPLMAPGVLLAEGDCIVQVQGRDLSQTVSPREALVNFAGQVVEIGVRRKGSSKTEFVRVKTLAQEADARYRDWVESNRNYVHQKTGGKIGYVHIPDMGAIGFAEFHRSFLQEYDRDGLVIDVRFNGGGHVSALLLEKLARRRLGFSQARWMGQWPYPGESPAGPLVALTNEFAGSDGDIFSHSFKLMKLGPLLGTRTWGGVIGIWPRHSLVDGGITTQPEFSYWFKDVGWKVENYGTDPDLPVDNLPHHYLRGQDQQLDVAIEEVSSLLKKTPAFRPQVAEFPDLSFQPN